MQIMHNIVAMNANRNKQKNNSVLSKSLEKLSSGYRINRSADDAAGLAISEKMRAQITGMETAYKNVKDGISLVKTTDGAMAEIYEMLNRLMELSTQAANGTYTQEERAAMQSEVDALLEVITRIRNTSNFNGVPLAAGRRNHYFHPRGHRRGAGQPHHCRHQ